MSWKHSAPDGSTQLAWYVTPFGNMRPWRANLSLIGSVFLKLSITIYSMSGVYQKVRLRAVSFQGLVRTRGAGTKIAGAFLVIGMSAPAVVMGITYKTM